MSRPRKSEALRLGTRLLWAQKLNAKRLRLGVGRDVAWLFLYDHDLPLISQQTMRKYETVGPPTLRKARAYSALLDLASAYHNGGEQFDLVDLVRRTPK